MCWLTGLSCTSGNNLHQAITVTWANKCKKAKKTPIRRCSGSAVQAQASFLNRPNETDWKRPIARRDQWTVPISPIAGEWDINSPWSSYHGLPEMGITQAHRRGSGGCSFHRWKALRVQQHFFCSIGCAGDANSGANWNKHSGESRHSGNRWMLGLYRAKVPR